MYLEYLVMKILIVEDDGGIVAFLSKGLKAEGFSVQVAKDGTAGSEMGCSEDFDVAIIDILLPDKDGYKVLREIRSAKPDLPVIMLSVKTDTRSKLHAFEGGAVDYVSKPFDFDELLARLRVHMTRDRKGGSNVLKIGRLLLDLPRRELRCGEKVLKLTAREFALVEYMARNKGLVLTRAQILDHVWEYDFDPHSNIVDVYIRYLREKFSELDGSVEIETVRGMGYRLREQERS